MQTLHSPRYEQPVALKAERDGHRQSFSEVVSPPAEREVVAIDDDGHELGRTNHLARTASRLEGCLSSTATNDLRWIPQTCGRNPHKVRGPLPGWLLRSATVWLT